MYVNYTGATKKGAILVWALSVPYVGLFLFTGHPVLLIPVPVLWVVGWITWVKANE